MRETIMHFIVEPIRNFICKNDPGHLGSFFADVFELTALAVMLIMVIRIYLKTKRLNTRMEEFHPDD